MNKYRTGDYIKYTYFEMGGEHGQLYPQMQIGHKFGTIIKFSIDRDQCLVENSNGERNWILKGNIEKIIKKEN
mgnify:CR=1 FL=1